MQTKNKKLCNFVHFFNKFSYFYRLIQKKVVTLRPFLNKNDASCDES